MKDRLLALMTELVDLPEAHSYKRPALLQRRQQLIAEKTRLEGGAQQSLPPATSLPNESATGSVGASAVCLASPHLSCWFFWVNDSAHPFVIRGLS